MDVPVILRHLNLDYSSKDSGTPSGIPLISVGAGHTPTMSVGVGGTKRAVLRLWSRTEGFVLTPRLLSVTWGKRLNLSELL